MPWRTDLAVDEIDQGLVALLQPLVFEDRVTGDVVTVPVGFISDGASIPIGLPRRLAGHPLTSGYLAAAILHDYEIAERDATWWRVHTRFGRALEASGVSWWRARILTACVVTMGPRW
jgi:hypothetical protein